jgi:2-methylisocitrate lyase-like PEP mutase family enzyme
VNVVVPSGPRLGRSDLAGLGVARITFGGGLAHVALHAATARLREFLAGGAGGISAVRERARSPARGRHDRPVRCRAPDRS